MTTKTTIRQERKPIYYIYKLVQEDTKEWYERAALECPHLFLILTPAEVEKYQSDFDDMYELKKDGFGYNRCGYFNVNK